MTYEEALSFIHSVDWKGSRLGLERTQELLGMLRNPEKKLKFIHIAGTNGKGSTAAMLSSILTEAGFCTGLYTSPFINKFNERMQVNGEMISDAELAETAAYIRPYAVGMSDAPTEFELITALAMVYFVRRKCDIVVLETGMGGALDSTNVIDVPEAAVITAMGLDHVAELGPTMADIARAKAGIIKPGGSVVAYGENPEADRVFEQVCKEQGAALTKPDFNAIVPGEFDLEGQSFSYKNWSDLRIPLAGRYQMNNAAVVLETVEVLRGKGWHISDSEVRKGLAVTRWPARFEVLQRDPVFIVDGGHNPHGISATASSLQSLFPD
ncbi:MAG: bifunctional folylpolyglutamate synthase/dihydrofolate synthase, partial [Oscillospiraceae bacterium]|nr:bifunctional folylpolyglutamate synthase/dihydrofolate synthase [Oscillospiraceae bacterium]